MLDSVTFVDWLVVVIDTTASNNATVMTEQGKKIFGETKKKNKSVREKEKGKSDQSDKMVR